MAIVHGQGPEDRVDVILLPKCIFIQAPARARFAPLQGMRFAYMHIFAFRISLREVIYTRRR